MATLPFRPPQFSDDVDWLPPWLQSTHSSSPTMSNQPGDHLFHHSFPDVDSIKSGNNHDKESNLRLFGESGHQSCSVFRLHLSGEDSSPITLTPCEKVLHFNLHLSTYGGSSLVSERAWDTSQDRLNSPDGKALHPVRELHGPKINMTSNVNNNTSDVKCCPLDENCSDSVEKILHKSKNSGPDNLEIYDTMDKECNDINDAVELSVAASEALVIREIMQTETIPEALSSEAILEVALRVKQARVDAWHDSLCCFEDPDNRSDILSDLSDSDLEDVYNDVGLSIRSMGNVSSMDPSVSRVKDTPMTPSHPEGDREVQSEWYQDQEIYFKNRSLARRVENNLDPDEAKDFPNVDLNVENHQQSFINETFNSITGTASHLNGTSENIQMSQGLNNDMIIVDDSAHQKFNSSLQLLNLGKTNFNRESDGSACGYHSRWLGGWSSKEGVVCGGKEPNLTIPVRKMLINEASYLSESTVVAPDQNSVVNYHHSCSKSSQVNKTLEDSYKTAAREALISQDVVKDSNSSFLDSLCSMVPCSISSEIGKSSMAIKNNDNPRVINADESLKIGTEVPLETIQTSCDRNGGNTGRKEHTELILDDVGINPIIRRQTKPLMEYSRGFPGNSPPSLEKSFNDWIEEEGDEVFPYGIEKVTCNNPIDTNMKAFVESIHACDFAKMNEECNDTRLFTMDQNISSNTLMDKVPKKRPLFRSKVSSVIPTSSEENHSRNSEGRDLEDHCRASDKNQAQMRFHMQDIPKSPVVLCHRTQRIRAPKLLVTDLLIGARKYDKVCGSENIYHKSRDAPQGQLHGLCNTEVSARKRVHFSDAGIKPRSNKSRKRNSSFKLFSRLELVDEDHGITSQEVKERLTNCHLNGRKLIFQGLNFLLTGFSKKKEQEINELLRKHGGMVLSDIPTPLPRTKERSSSRSHAERRPVVICSRKLQTTTFLYGCAVNAFLLKAGWAYDSIEAGSVLPPDKYEVLSNRTDRMLNQIGKSTSQNDDDYIFVKVGIMLHGTPSFCTKFANVVKHGRGVVYKSLQWLVQSLDKKKISLGVLVVEEDNRATRHLKKYASEQKIPVVSASWIVNSLLEGKLPPVQEKINLRRPPRPPAIKVPVAPVLQDWSQEI